MQGSMNGASPSATPTDSPKGGITIPALPGTIGHTRQKPSRVGLGDRQYSFDVTTGPSARVVPRSNPSPPPLHVRQYSEGAGMEKTPPVGLLSGRNASVSSLDTTQLSMLNGIDGSGQSLSGGRRRHGHGHSHAHSHHHHPNLPSPAAPKPPSMMSTAEYSLHILFTNFVRVVEDLFRKIKNIPLDVYLDIPVYFGPGADPELDKVLMSLGHIGAHKPTPVINTVMYWRQVKAKPEAADGTTGSRSFTPTPANVPPGAAAAITAGIISNPAMTPLGPLPPSRVQHLGSTPPALIRRQTEPVSVVASQGQDGGQFPAGPSANNQLLERDRTNRCAIYILCRALIEVVKHTTAEALTDDIASKIEAIVFQQLVKEDSEDSYRRGAHKSASWHIFAELLGCFSNIRFSSVSDRFIEFLEKYKHGVIPREVEGSVETVIRGMTYLKIKIYPMDALEESAEFLASLEKFFQRTDNVRVKYAYMEAFNRLILPVAGIATAEVNTPAWANTIQSLYPVIHRMMQKQRHWHVACPLAVTLLCVSPREYFASKWWDLCEPILLKFRDKTFKNVALACVARLVWCYVFRCAEPAATMTRRLDTIIKTLFPSGKKAVVPSDTPLETFIQLVRFIGAKHHDYAYKMILHPLLNGDIISRSTGLISVELLQPERMTIAIRSYLAILSDIENKTPTPNFPGVAFDYEDEIPTDKRATAILSASALTTARVEEYYNSFSRLLGLIAYSTDQHFGGAALLEDKPHSAPKTPISASFSFTNSDAPSTPTAMANIRDRHLFFDLLHAVFDAFPTCIPRNLSTVKLIEMLCNGTAHSHYGIAQSASNALRILAKRPNYSQLVVTGFARFMFKFDEKMSRNPATGLGLLTSPHAENTLGMYVELLRSWLECIRAKKQDSGADAANAPATPEADPNVNVNRGEEMEMTTVWTVIEETEAHGLFFLCHQNLRVRHFALKILRLIREFDTALLDESHDSGDTAKLRAHNRNPSRVVRGPRVIDVFDANEVLDGFLHDADALPVAERSRLQSHYQRRKEGNVLIRIAEGSNLFDVSLWSKCFPTFIKICFERFPMTMVLTRNMICDRLVQMHSSILNTVETTRSPTAGPFDMVPKISPRTQAAESLVEQWKLYLMVACSTLTLTDEQTSRTQVLNHGRKKSIPYQSFQRLTSARSVFRLIIPLLGCDHDMVREAVIAALGCINVNLYKVLLEDLQVIIKPLNEEALRFGGPKQPSRNRQKSNRQRQEITHVLNLTSHFLQRDEILKDEWILGQLVGFIRGMKLFLTDAEVQLQWEFQELRRHFCGLVEAISEAIRKLENPSRWLPLEGRTSLFRLIEEWCGHGPRSFVKDREKRMRMSIMDEYKDVRDRGALTAAMEIEKKKVEIAALSCMASLCNGPYLSSIENDGSQKAIMSFDIVGVLQWVDAVFNSSSDRFHKIGRRALRNVLSDNLDQVMVMDETLAMCYLNPPEHKSTQSYFNVIADLIIASENTGYKIYQIFALCQYKLGDPAIEIRQKAFKLLTISEERFFGRSVVQPFEAGALSQTVAVYKKAQYMLVRTLTREHYNHAMLIFSELCGFFAQLKDGQRREIVAIMLPWISIMELQNELNDAELSPAAYMVLVNLFEMTVKYSDKLQTEVEALWSALASATSHNVRTIMNFLTQQSYEQRNPAFVTFARQIVVYLGRSAEGATIFEGLLVAMEPRKWKWEDRPALLVPDFVGYPHAAVLSELIPAQSKLLGFSTGQLALIFIVDLVAEPAPWITANLPFLLQVIFVQLDSTSNLVYEAAKSLLLNVLLSYLSVEGLESAVRTKLRVLVDDLRGRDYKSLWSYDSNGRNKGSSSRAPRQMERLISEVIATLGDKVNPDLRRLWGKEAMHWSTKCSVRHLACRSFQIFRCLGPTMDQEMLPSMLARLSNTISDNTEDREGFQGFSLEVLCTLNSIIRTLDESQLLMYPQLFWVTIASLNTIHEREFLEVLPLLESMMAKLDLSQPTVIQTLTAAFPPKWEGRFEGIQPLLLRGLRSSITLTPTMRILDLLDALPMPNELVGGESRLMFGLLANLPRFLHALDNQPLPEEVIVRAERLCNLAAKPEQENIRKILTSYAKARFRTKEDFVRQIVSVIRDAYFPEYEAQGLTFLLGLLTNRLPWMKIKSMVILKTMLPYVNLRKPEFAGIGGEILSPLLRLLQSEYADQALEVLDEAITFVGQPMDRNLARMSLGNRSLKKEYENSVTVFGIPDDSGWAVSAPALMAATTRQNVHNVFYTCPNVPSPQNPASPAMPEVQFHREDFTFTGITIEERTDTLLSNDERSDEKASLGDMVSALHSLDVFFTEDVTSTSNSGHMHSPSYPENDYPAIDPSETAPAIYDSRVAGILSRSLARSPSVTSLRTTFAESFNTSGYSRQRPPLSPSSSGFGLSPRSFSRKMHRPGLSNRSISSPSEFDVPESSSSDDDSHDDDDMRSPTQPGDIDESSFALETLLKTTSAPKSSIRSRFLGGGSKEKEYTNGKQDKKISPRGPNMLRGAKSPKTQFRNMHRDLEVQSLQLANGRSDEWNHGNK